MMEANMKEFAQYLTNVSFDEALHHIRHVSYERITANEQSCDAARPESSRPRPVLSRRDN